MDISKAKDILDYWFSKGLYTPDYDKWFMKSQDYDEEIRQKFGDLLKEAERGKGFGWLHTKDSYVAYIILLDQFSRHIYRGSGDSFKNDNGCMIFVELGWDMYSKQLKGYEFMFAFMPYMHTENLNYQCKACSFNPNSKFGTYKNLYGTGNIGRYTINPNNCNPERLLTNPENLKKDLFDSSPKQTKYDKEYEMLKSMEPHVRGHLQTIRQFGRFPKRNKALGRKSTEEEIAYMNQPEVQKRPY